MGKETEQERRIYETILSATPDLVYVFDLEYRFTYANKALLTMWGKSWENAVGKGLRDNGYEEWHAAMHEREIDHVAATGESVRGEVSFPHAVLGRRVYDYILVPVFNNNGKVEAVAGTTRDISDMKQAEARILDSEERFRNLVLQAPTAIAVFRGEELIAEVANDEYLKMIDKKAGDFINKPLYESLPTVRAAIEPIIEKVIKTGEIFRGNEFEVILNRHDKNEKGYFNFTYSPLYAGSEVIDGFIVVANEVTSQVAARLKVEESEAALANAIELAELGTWKYDVKTDQMTLSNRFAQMFGYKSLSVDLSRANSAVVDSDQLETMKKFRAAILPGAGRFDAEYRIVNATTGNEHIVHSIGQAVFDESGKPVRLEGTTQDVTAQRELQLALENQVQVRTEELQATNEELATTNEELSESSALLMRSNEELSQFAYVASHDLQEPVRKISVFVELLEKSLPEIDERSRKNIDKISDSANRMLTLIRDVLTHSQISNRGSNFVQIDLNNILTDTLDEFEVLIRAQNCKVKSNKLPVIDAIEIQMNQLFSNLISNAMKFAKPDQQLEIEIKAEQLSDNDKQAYPTLVERKVYYRILFIDNGIGFDQTYAAQIFEIFQRLHKRSEYSGTGIGLATCKKIVLNHGGIIAAMSSPGQGATFEVILPAKQS